MATPYNFNIPQSQVLDVGQWGENALAVKKRRTDEERQKKQDTMNDEIFGMKKEEHQNALADRLRNQQKEDEDRKWTEYERSAKQKMTKIQMDETYIGLSKNILANIDTSDPAKFQDSFMQALDKYNVLVQNRGLTPEEAEQATKSVALQFGDINTIKRVQAEQLGKPESAPGQVMYDVNRGILTPEQGTSAIDAQNTKAMMGPEQPSTVREWEYFNTLSPEDRERYLSMKRAQQNIDIGGSVVQPSMGVPGQIAGEFEKTLPPEKTPQAIGEAETAKRQAELASEKKKMYPKARETKISLERQWDVVSGQIDKAIEKVSPFTAGVGSVASVIPATPQRDLRETLATIRANIGFDKLQDMRNNSPTGGALGQVSDTENKLLQAVQGSLDQGQSPAQLKENLANIKMLMNELKEQKKTAFATDFGEVERGASNPQIGPAKISSDADYDSLPSGTEFIAPDGSRRRKP